MVKLWEVWAPHFIFYFNFFYTSHIPYISQNAFDHIILLLSTLSYPCVQDPFLWSFSFNLWTVIHCTYISAWTCQQIVSAGQADPNFILLGGVWCTHWFWSRTRHLLHDQPRHPSTFSRDPCCGLCIPECILPYCTLLHVQLGMKFIILFKIRFYEALVDVFQHCSFL